MKVVLKIASPSTSAYRVKGKDLKEAAEYMRSNPNFSYKHKDGNTNQITITAKPTIAMPQWPGASKLKGNDKKAWNSMMRALAKHEAHHHKIFETDAKKFKKETEAAGDIPKGETAGKMTAFFTASQTNQDKYDTRTNHGEKEGVKLP